MPELAQHPAKFNDAVLEAARPFLEGFSPILDPFAGVGRIHELGMQSYGIELEEEWAVQGQGPTLIGDMLSSPLPEGWPAQFGAVFTSPCYGNRMADHHTQGEADKSTRNTYRHKLGREPSAGSSATMQWGPEYRDFHLKALDRIWQWLPVEGRFILNMKNHIRDGVEQRVVEWWIQTCLRNFSMVAAIPVKAGGNRHGANSELRTEHEFVIVMDKT